MLDAGDSKPAMILFSFAKRQGVKLMKEQDSKEASEGSDLPRPRKTF